jgi:hypothetical protein
VYHQGGINVATYQGGNFLYQSTVVLSPSSRDIFSVHPNSITACSSRWCDAYIIEAAVRHERNPTYPPRLPCQDFQQSSGDINVGHLVLFHQYFCPGFPCYDDIKSRATSVTVQSYASGAITSSGEKADFHQLIRKLRDELSGSLSKRAVDIVFHR